MLAVGVLVACGLAIAACGSPSQAGSASSSSSGPSLAVQAEHAVENAINGDAERNIRGYFKGKLKFTVYTACRPTTPDNDNWSCATTIRSSLANTSTCSINTPVRSVGNKFDWTGPVPFAADATQEDCGTLHSEMPINMPVR
jgi:hypothetical protein